jgi:hypothetical protein
MWQLCGLSGNKKSFYFSDDRANPFGQTGLTVAVFATIHRHLLSHSVQMTRNLT